MDLYIYYRALAGNTAELQKRVTAMQEQLARQYKIATGLKRRSLEKDQLLTWMEVYLNVPDAFEAALKTAVATAALDELIDGPRHIEHFLDFSPCA